MCECASDNLVREMKVTAVRETATATDRSSEGFEYEHVR